MDFQINSSDGFFKVQCIVSNHHVFSKFDFMSEKLCENYGNV